ncbi:glycosyltransferase (plasmid) [Haladaptatus sp. SPP-AMP-3]|uniref:glycosyltransferase n=1 Tax=Haladaptatus sp. SPP-AMP-3 TaxID=3121295 RepID=UPI003C2F45B7
MNALFLPNHDDNPDQLLLADALESHGVSVSRGSSSGLAPVLSGVARNDPDVLHFHWLHQSVIERTRTRSYVAAVRFAFEVLSGSVILAMSFGTPVIAPRLGCLPDVLGPKTELLYDPDDPNDLRAAMKRAPTLDLDEIGRQTRERSMSFDWDVVGEWTAAVYRSATDDRPVETRFPESDAYDTKVNGSAEAVTDGGTDDASDGEAAGVTGEPSANGRNTKEERR